MTSAFADEIAEIDLADLTPDRLHGWSAYPLGVAWATGQFGADLAAVPGVELAIESTVPVGAGLSSSAAIESAVAVALNEVWQLGFDRQTLAKVGQLAENRAVGAPTGIMDQSASLLGRTDHAVFLDCRSLDSELVPLGFAEAGLELLIMDTGVSHSHATGGYASRRASCEAGAALMGVASLRDLGVGELDRAQSLMDDETFRRVRHVVTENARVLETVATLRERGPRPSAPCSTPRTSRCATISRSRLPSSTSPSRPPGERRDRGADDRRRFRRCRHRPRAARRSLPPAGGGGWRLRRARVHPADDLHRDGG